MKPTNQKHKQESESEWTHLSISTLNTQPTRNPISTSNEIESSSDSLVKISDLQLLTQPNQFPAESDSSTNFDPQAWKRGDTGTTKRSKRTNNSSLGNTYQHTQVIESTTSDDKIQSSLSSSYYFDAAFISPKYNSNSNLIPVSTERRRSTSTNRKSHRPTIYQSSSNSTPIKNQSNQNNRPTSDLGPTRKKRLFFNISNPPTWKAYTGKDVTSCSTKLSDLDRKQEFIQALANLKAMASMTKLDYISSNSNNSSNHHNHHHDNIDDGDPDEPRPGHADLPTSTFNSAVDELEDEPSPLINPTDDHHSDPDSNSHSNLSRFFRWSGYVGKAISLKTWQLVGLGSVIFGIGIWAGSLIGRNFSHNKHPHVFKFL